jgi:hypothetical protein
VSAKEEPVKVVNAAAVPAGTPIELALQAM